MNRFFPSFLNEFFELRSFVYRLSSFRFWSSLRGIQSVGLAETRLSSVWAQYWLSSAHSGSLTELSLSFSVFRFRIDFIYSQKVFVSRLSMVLYESVFRGYVREPGITLWSFNWGLKTWILFPAAMKANNLLIAISSVPTAVNRVITDQLDAIHDTDDIPVSTECTTRLSEYRLIASQNIYLY